MNECVAVVILIIILLALYFYRQGYTSGVYDPTLGSYINYDYDLPLHQYAYNRIYHRSQPPEHDMILYTEDNFRGIAVPVRKEGLYLFAEQISPHFKTWYYKSIKTKPGTKLRLYAISASSLYNQKPISIDFGNNDPLLPNINTFIKSQSKIMSSDFGNRFDKNIINTRYYLRELK